MPRRIVDVSIKHTGHGFAEGWKYMVSESHLTAEAIVDHRSSDRRAMSDRRVEETESATEFTGTERRKSSRRKVERRRQIDPTTCERDYSDDEIEFMCAMDDYKRRSGRQFPTWSEVLEVIRSMGYRKVEEPTEIFK